jgi:hypothetical protein
METLAKIDTNSIFLIHYSHSKGLKILDPNKQGTGQPGFDTKYGIPLVKTTYYYRENLIRTPWSERELFHGNAIARYYAYLNPSQKIYDLGLDADSLRKKLLESGKTVNKGIVTRDEYFQAIKDAGYYGVYNSCSDLLFDAVAVFYMHSVIEDLLYCYPRK